MPRWVEHESDEDAASTSDDDAEMAQHIAPQQASKRKAPAPEDAPTSNKKVKLSISLSRAKMECHVGLLAQDIPFHCSTNLSCQICHA